MSHLSLEAVAFVIALPKRKQRQVLDLTDQLAKQPFRISDYQMLDSAGRAIENLLIDGFLISYWVDHATREVRILDLIQV